LRIGYTATTDASIDALARLSAMQTLDLSGTKVSPAGYARLHAALPSCKITGDQRP
jgi:hypothetical protein